MEPLDYFEENLLEGILSKDSMNVMNLKSAELSFCGHSGDILLYLVSGAILIFCTKLYIGKYFNGDHL